MGDRSEWSAVQEVILKTKKVPGTLKKLKLKLQVKNFLKNTSQKVLIL